jgi:hypothetical protein
VGVVNDEDKARRGEVEERGGVSGEYIAGGSPRFSDWLTDGCRKALASRCGERKF